MFTGGEPFGQVSRQRIAFHKPKSKRWGVSKRQFFNNLLSRVDLCGGSFENVTWLLYFSGAKPTAESERRSAQRPMQILHKFRYALSPAYPCLPAIALWPGLQRALVVDNSLTVWFLETDPGLKAYRDFGERFWK